MNGAGDNRQWRLAAGLAALTVLLSVAPTLEPGIQNWDVQVKTQVAWNLLHGQGLALDQAPSPIYLVEGRNGRTYGMYPFLAYVLQIPTALLFMAADATYEGLVPLVLLASTAAVVVAAARRSGLSPQGALAGALLASLATALRPMVGVGHDNGIEALAMATLLWAGAGAPRERDVLWAGLITGGAIGVRLGAIPLVVPGAALLLLRRRGHGSRLSREAILFAAGCAPGIVSAVLFNLYRFGSVFEVHPTIAAAREIYVPWFSPAYWDGILGLTVSPGKGALWYSPPLIAAVLFAIPVARRFPAAAVLIGSYLVAALALYGRLAFWHGDWGWGPRLIAPAFVASAPLAWWCWERVSRYRVTARAGIAALALFLVGIQALPAAAAPIPSYLRIMDERAVLGAAPRPVREFPMAENRKHFYFRIDTSPLVVLGRAYWDGVTEDRPGSLQRYMGERLRRVVPWAILGPALCLAAVAAGGSRRRPRPGARP